METQAKTKTVVRIGGRDYTMVGAHTEEHMRRLAVFVDRKMEELTLATRLPQPMVAVLTAMNIADELLRAQDENTRLRRELMALHTPPEKEKKAKSKDE